MPLILTPITNLNDNIEMPYEMRPYVSPAAWAEIIRAKNVCVFVCVFVCFS